VQELIRGDGSIGHVVAGGGRRRPGASEQIAAKERARGLVEEYASFPRSGHMRRVDPAELVSAYIEHLDDQRVLAIAGAIDMLEGVPIVVGDPPPGILMAVVRRLEAIEWGAIDAPPAAIRLTVPNGAVLSVHAARLRDSSGSGPIALTITPATSAERSSLFLAAHGLTPAQRRVAELILQGRTTAQIVVELRISAHTVQDHLKGVFDKVGVRSRRELVGTMLGQ
jgi:DNA-binding CsgD family transcriptional regulator